MLRWFVRRGLLEAETAAGMLTWSHSGVHGHDGVWVPPEDRAFATRLARSCARHPVALSRLAYRADSGTVTYQSDTASGPTAGAETVDALEFLARVVSHIPNKGQVLQRYYGWYANRTRGRRRRAGVPEPAPAVAAEAVPAALADVRRRWAEAAAPALRGRPAPLSAVRPRDARRRVHHPTARDRPDSDPPAPPCAPRHLGVSRSRPRRWILGSGVCGLHAGWLGAPLGPHPDPARAGGRPLGPAIRAPHRLDPLP